MSGNNCDSEVDTGIVWSSYLGKKGDCLVLWNLIKRFVLYRLSLWCNTNARVSSSFVNIIEQQLPSRSVMAVNVSANFVSHFYVQNNTHKHDSSAKRWDLVQFLACIGKFFTNIVMKLCSHSEVLLASVQMDEFKGKYVSFLSDRCLKKCSVKYHLVFYEYLHALHMYIVQ
jgi:hypothetical protein